MILYTCENMGLSFGGETILEQINITINEKDRIGIIGDNGAGKTTFVKLLLGEYQPTEGSLYNYGKITADTGYLPQNAGLNSNLSIRGIYFCIFRTDSSRRNHRRIGRGFKTMHRRRCD